MKLTKAIAKDTFEQFYNNSLFINKINKPNRILLAKTSAILHYELMIKKYEVLANNKDYNGKKMHQEIIKEIDKL